MDYFERLTEEDKNIAMIIAENSNVLDEATTSSGNASSPELVMPLISYVQENLVSKDLVDVQPIQLKEGKVYGLDILDDTGNVILGANAVGTFNDAFSELTEIKAYQEFTPAVDVTTHITDALYDFKIKANYSPLRDIYITSPSAGTWTLASIASQINAELGATKGFAEFVNTAAAAITTGDHDLNIGIDGATPAIFTVTLTTGDNLTTVAGIIDAALTGASCSVSTTGKIRIISDTTGSSSSIVIEAATVNTDVLDIIGAVETVDTGDTAIKAIAEVNTTTSRVRITSTELIVARTSIEIFEGTTAGADHFIALVGIEDKVIATSEATSIRGLTLKLNEASVIAKTRKAKLNYSKELSQDFKVLKYDLEKEKLKIIGTEIAAGIDFDIVEAIKTHSDHHSAITYTWDYTSATDNYLDILYKLKVSIMKASGNIAAATRKGLANFIIVPTLVQPIISSIPGFVGEENSTLGPICKIGKLDYLDVYINTFDTTTYDMYVGKKPSGNLRSGIVFSPYKIDTDPTVTDPNNFTIHQAIFNRYGITKVLGGNTLYHKVVISVTAGFPY
jgi:hypothetical protein